MHRDIAFALISVATFALAILYLGYSGRTRSERDAGHIRRLEARVAALEGGPTSARTAQRVLSLLADVDGSRSDAALRRYADHRSPFIRVQAAKLLQRRGDSGWIEREAQRLTEDLRSSDLRIRLQSLALLGVARQPSTIHDILPLLHESNVEIQKGALRSLGGFKDPSLAAAIAPFLQHPVDDVRATAARALQEIQR